jgi:hypothetical protein
MSQVLPAGQKNPLIKKSTNDYVLYCFENPDAVSNPIIYKKKKNILTFYPFITGTVYEFSVSWASQAPTLELDTQEDDIPYPPTYHDVLVDGALYYLFADEAGFRSSEKEAQAAKRYATGSNELLSYLQGSNSNIVSTFCNV